MVRSKRKAEGRPKDTVRAKAKMRNDRKRAKKRKATRKAKRKKK